MTDSQKIALARIIADLIKADNIIEDAEMDTLAKLDEYYKILPEHKVHAMTRRFTWAISELNDLSPNTKNKVLEDLRDLSKSDGACVPREALLLLALEYSLSPQTSYLISTFSCDLKSSNLNDLYIVYVESYEDLIFNNQIKESFDDICDILSNCGIDFIYVPNLSKELKEMDPNYVKNVISYMAPHLLKENMNIQENKQINQLYNSFCSIDTQNFCKDLLSERLGVKEMDNVKPSVMINIGTSLEPYCGSETRVFTEFMCIQIKENVKDEIRKFTNDYKKYLTNDILLHKSRGLKYNFKYFGFYKALFDLLVYGNKKQSETKVILDVDHQIITFEGMLNIEPKLTNKEMAIYSLLIVESISPSKSQKGVKRTSKEDKKIQDRYTLIVDYWFTKLNAKDKYFNSLPTIISNIKRKLNTVLNIDNKQDFIPQKRNESYFVNIDNDSVVIREDGKDYRVNEYNWQSLN